MTRKKKKVILSKSTILNKIKKIEPRLREMKVKELYLFGSFARGDIHRNSDIDVLVSFSDRVDLFDLADLKHLLQDAFGRNVDIVMKDALRKEFQDQVEQEMIRAA